MERTQFETDRQIDDIIGIIDKTIQLPCGHDLVNYGHHLVSCDHNNINKVLRISSQCHTTFVYQKI